MLPTSLESATRRMMAPNSVIREAGVLGNDFVEHFGGTREHEVALWNEAVTNWEGRLSRVVSLHWLMRKLLVERYLELV
jgi:glutamine synthetase